MLALAFDRKFALLAIILDGRSVSDPDTVRLQAVKSRMFAFEAESKPLAPIDALLVYMFEE